jgi:hypothetical protein
MAWSTVPVTGGTSDVLKAQFDEIKGALNEREVAIGITQTSAAALANGAQARTLLTTYRSAVDTLIPYFVNPSNSYAAWTKSACLTAALGAGRTNWLTDQTPAYMFADEINELRLVINKLAWRSFHYAINPSDYRKDVTDGSDVSWNASWTAAKAAYAAAPFADSPGGGFYAGQATTAYSPGGSYTYEHNIATLGSTDFKFLVGTTAIAEANMLVGTFYLYGTETVDLNLYVQASFAGTATAIPWPGTGTHTITIPTPTADGSGYAHCSILPDPDAPANWDVFRPADGNNQSKGAFLASSSVGAPALRVRYGFGYA